MKTKRLSHADELSLVKLAQSGKIGSDYALTKLITHNTGLVHKIVNRFPMKNATCTYDDLYQEGVLGLTHGIRKFDATRGVRLSTYVYRWIQAYVKRYYLNHYRTVRLPVHVIQQNTQLNKQIEHLTSELGRTPTLEEVCDLNENADSLICSSLFTLSLNNLTGEDGELGDFVGEDHTQEIDDELDVHFLLSQLKEQVSPRDYSILLKRYGLDNEGERTLQELSTEYDVTRARVHQIENNLLSKLRSLVTTKDS